jgi:hypothetical protein
MIPYIARLLEEPIHNGILPEDWEKATVIPIHKGGDKMLAANYRPIRLTFRNITSYI